VTIEDLIEEIVGEIQDEYDVEEDMIVKLDDDRARIDGRASVDDLAEVWSDLDLASLLEDRDEYDTIGGLVFHRLGEVPTPGAVVTVDGITLTVESTDGRRVRKVLAVREPRDREGQIDGEDDA
jgi:magnesium and cobalt transporter